jgi:tetratricopeptide (TPR) repeat protein
MTKKYAEAVEFFEKAVKQEPKRDTFQYQLGQAYLYSGKTEKALQSFKQAIDLALMKENLQNDVAYQLSEKNIYLDEAEAWSKEAIQQAEGETQDIDLDKLGPKSFRLMNQLSAYWDTLGWVYSRKGEFKMAERYLQASWWLRQSAPVARHLADVYDKLHQQSQAAHFRLLAEATPDGNGSLTLQQVMRNNKSSWKRGEWDAREQLGKMRTIHLPAISSKSESAEFFVLLSTGKSHTSAPVKEAAEAHMVKLAVSSNVDSPAANTTVDSVKFITGSESLKKAEKNLQHANFGFQVPDNGLTKVIRRGILMCSPYSNGCNFTLLTSESVHSAN